jgi:PAS domain S-box-containing protein
MTSKLSATQQHIVERLYKTFTLDTTPSAIVVFDTHYTIIYMNRAAESLYGWKAEEAICNSEQKIFKTRLLDSTTEDFRRSLRSRLSWSGEVIQQRKNGGRIFIETTIKALRNERHITIGYVAVNRDITEHKHIEYNLRFLSVSAKTLSSSLNYQITLHRVAQLAVPRIADWCTIELLNDEGKLEQVAIAHRDPKKLKWAAVIRKKFPTDLREDQGVGKVLKTGKPEFHPYIPDEVLAKTTDDPERLALLRKLGLSSVIIAPITTSDHKTIGVITLIATESRRHYTKNDLQMAEKLASRASLAIENAKLFQNAGQEIIERGQAEKRAKESEQQLDLILNNVADGITMQNVEGKVVYANNIAAQAIGFESAKDMLGASTKEFARKLKNFELKDETGTIISYSELPGRLILKGRPVTEKIIQFTNKKTGEVRWSHIKTRSTPTQKEKPEYIVNIMTDITEQKELENRKDNFISMASHELKTPITTLKIYTDLLNRQLVESGHSTFKKPLEMMNSQINKLSRLIADLLNLSKIQAGKLEFRMSMIDLNKLVRNIVDQIQPTVGHSITIFGQVKKKIYGDPERIGQVLINLLTNAVKYSPQGDKIHIHLTNEQNYVTVSVRDFGIGIERQYRKKIFERFYQISDEVKTFPGLGMGLYISQEIIRRHNGLLWVESKKGKGSTFTFTLPTKKHKPHER